MEQILIVEDERKLNDLIRDYLTSMGYATTQCFEGLSAVGLAQSLPADLVVLDGMLPGLDGIEVARRIRAHQDVPILMLTARETEADKLLGLEVGADDYMTKPFSVRELAARIRAILRRTGREGSGVARGTLEHRGISLDPVKRTLSKHGQPIQVTSAQFELLHILLQEPGRVFSRKELIEAISGYVYEGYERTMDVQIRNLRKALEDDPAQPTLLLTIWGVGYKVQE